MSKVFLKDSKKTPSAAIFISGNGSNAEKMLARFHTPGRVPYWIPKVLVTDRPLTSRAKAIAREYGLPLVEHGIAAFYRKHGMSQVTVSTEEGRRIRQLWTDEMLEKLQPFQIDFGILAGFVSLTNIAEVIPCLNVHPGDLTYLRNGRRYLTGLHTVPVELAILEGLPALRSSVIMVRPYSGRADEVDSGHILGISEPVPLDLQGHSLDELRRIFANRVFPHFHGLNRDLLFDIATHNQELLKRSGDHYLYPEVIDDFARGLFSESDGGRLLYNGLPVNTVEYRRDGSRVPLPVA